MWLISLTLEAVQGSNNAQRPATKLPFVPFWGNIMDPTVRPFMHGHLPSSLVSVLVGIVPGV